MSLSLPECAICFEVFGERNIDVSVLRCGHAYHRLCIAEWVTRNSPEGRSTTARCPTCKEKIQWSNPKGTLPKLFVDFTPMARQEKHIESLEAALQRAKVEKREMSERHSDEVDQLEDVIEELSTAKDRLREKLAVKEEEHDKVVAKLRTQRKESARKLEREEEAHAKEVARLRNALKEAANDRDKYAEEAKAKANEVASLRKALEETSTDRDKYAKEAKKNAMSLKHLFAHLKEAHRVLAEAFVKDKNTNKIR